MTRIQSGLRTTEFGHRVNGHSILFLGSGTHAAYLTELETLPSCSMLHRVSSLSVPEDVAAVIDLVILELGPLLAAADKPLHEIIHGLKHYPLVALTDKAHEHRGIEAMRAGANGYILCDDVSAKSQGAIFAHAVMRHALSERLLETDVGVLSILRNINDGVVVVDLEGKVLEINPAARRMLGMGPRILPDPGWEQTFCGIDAEGKSCRSAFELPLARARRGEKFENQLARYCAPGQPDTILSLNGHGLYDGNGQLIGGLVTFRDVTESEHQRRRLRQQALYDELTGLANRRLFNEHLRRALSRATRRSPN